MNGRRPFRRCVPLLACPTVETVDDDTSLNSPKLSLRTHPLNATEAILPSPRVPRLGPSSWTNPPSRGCRRRRSRTRAPNPPHRLLPLGEPLRLLDEEPFWVLLAALLTALACGVYVSETLLAVAGLLLAVLVLAVLWPLLGVRGLECRVRFEQTRGREGLPTAVEIEIVNRRPWPVWGLSLTKGFVTRDDENSGTGQGGIALAGVGGWSRTVVPWSFVPPTRGVYPLEPSRIETGFPFGLYRAGKAVEVRNELIVWPAAAKLDTLPRRGRDRVARGPHLRPPRWKCRRPPRHTPVPTGGFTAFDPLGPIRPARQSDRL